MPRFTMPRLQPISKPKFLHGIPDNSIFAIATLIAVNALVWIAAGIVLHFHPRLISPAALSYVLGLRHALDADHIAAIDLMTRRLIASGQRPATVGTFFSLGHSTIVIVTCIVVAATSGALRERFDGFQHVGNIVGTSVSAAFLIILCIGNGWVLYKLIQRLQGILQERRNQVRLEGFVEEETQIQDHFALEGGGFLTRVFKRLFRVIDRPWKMYPLGVVFGLGFDTSSEIAILGIASIQAVQGTSIWLILIFPILFTGEWRCICIRVGSLLTRDSWHVHARYHRWSPHDGPVHVESILKRRGCYSVLFHRPHRNYSRGISFHRHRPSSLPNTERRRPSGAILGWSFFDWRPF